MDGYAGKSAETSLNRDILQFVELAPERTHPQRELRPNDPWWLSAAWILIGAFALIGWAL